MRSIPRYPTRVGMQVLHGDVSQEFLIISPSPPRLSRLYIKISPGKIKPNFLEGKSKIFLAKKKSLKFARSTPSALRSSRLFPAVLGCTAFHRPGMRLSPFLLLKLHRDYYFSPLTNAPAISAKLTLRLFAVIFPRSSPLPPKHS